MSFSPTNCIFFLLCCLGIATWLSIPEVVGATVTCYVCSWSTPNSVFNGSEIPDYCTSTKFLPQAAHTVNCYAGCETVALRESRNGRIVHFHRNCIPATAARMPEDRCQDIDGRFFFESRCSCLSNYCNSSPSSLFPAFGGIILLASTILIHQSFFT